MRRQLLPALVMIACLTVLTGLAYPLAVWGAASVLFSGRANGSLIKVDGKAVGSALLGQNFTEAKYFWPRPSAAGTDGYDGLGVGGLEPGAVQREAHRRGQGAGGGLPRGEPPRPRRDGPRRRRHRLGLGP